mmetsp:Transcript_7281/g.10734  ORF Transcript_7281/g.10734 Transcript_7281/m.10734 type:complete len:169 (-) Transcript_7281:202-708(-)|eukprot:CAMPEP_0196809970 /NCGR_PEP_ID=MMETSP1362-20130617/9839_1 /TAXON_ID=163516 /ORGANISM="Leptocylindrus danicus, Strain CCMP1856" /LENGTH=168 /DNA_ID=CAMNT_0042184821 /DNA_START=30 /DNA_END=536 /DNA_ORIENTATION=+
MRDSLTHDDDSLVDLRQKAEEYGAFLDQNLQPQLEAIVRDRDSCEKDIAEYVELTQKIEELILRRNNNPKAKRIQAPLECLADLGHKVAYSHAVVDDPESIFVDIGYGFHIEFSLGEALQFIEKRIKFLKEFKLKKVVREANMISEHYTEAVTLLVALKEEIDKKSSC